MTSSLTTRWRNTYSKLPPAAQMIGLQLWLPVFFITAFCLCYIMAFHSPKMHDIPVAVMNTPSASVVTDRVDTASPGMFQFSFISDKDDAIESVRAGHNAAALTVPAQPGQKAELVIATAHQYQAASLVKVSFQQIFATSGGVQITDIAPLPPSDSFGQGAMYMMMSWCIAGYMVAMFIGMMGAPLSHLMRVGILVGGALVLSLLANLLAGLAIGVYPASHFGAMFGIAFLWILAIGLFTNGLSYFFGRFITGPALLLFVFLSIPSSGAAFPAWMVPSFFGHLQPYVVGHGITEMIKRQLYGVGAPYWQGFLLMGVYALIGVVTMFIGKRWRESREVDRILAGKTTMMAAAQGGMMRHGMANRAQVLRHHGIDPDTGKPLFKADDDEAGDGEQHGQSSTARDDSEDTGRSDGDKSHHDNSHRDDNGYDDNGYDPITDLENSVSVDMMTNGGRSLGLGQIDREYDARTAAKRSGNWVTLNDGGSRTRPSTAIDTGDGATDTAQSRAADADGIDTNGHDDGRSDAERSDDGRGDADDRAEDREAEMSSNGARGRHEGR